MNFLSTFARLCQAETNSTCLSKARTSPSVTTRRANSAVNASGFLLAKAKGLLVLNNYWSMMVR